MLEFKKFEVKDIDVIKKYLDAKGELSCETDLLNLLVWQCAYGNMFAVAEDQLIIKSGEKENEIFNLPFGNSLSKGIELIREYAGVQYPRFWVQQGRRFDEFKEKFGEFYVLEKNRNAYDYIYSQSDLAALSGKRYHSKRNHISAFSRQYDWEYKPLTKERIPDVLKCAEKWYSENEMKLDGYMECEKQGISFILSNFDDLNVKGGIIYVEGQAVAFTLGSAINDKVFDVLVEKALPEYSVAYTVINNEFAKTLTDFEYINREDDMGLEGLRKAKLSYKPKILLEKYVCENISPCREIYHEAFAEESDFENKFFKVCKDHCKRLKVNGETVAIAFTLPCKIGERDALYLFALATDKKHRKKGYMAKLIEEIKAENDCVLILRPASEELIQYYKKFGFRAFTASNEEKEPEVIPLEGFARIADEYRENGGSYTAMYYYKEELDLEGLCFPYSMQ